MKLPRDASFPREKAAFDSRDVLSPWLGNRLEIALLAAKVGFTNLVLSLTPSSPSHLG